MPAQPPRRTTPAPHLLPQVVPVEKALLARADEVSGNAQRITAEIRKNARIRGGDPADPGLAAIGGVVADVIAAEFRALAAELHYWD